MMRESRYNIWVERHGRHYVYNGVSGALLRLEAAEYASLPTFLSGETVVGEMDVFNKLVQGRMLVADDVDETALLKRRYSTSQQQSRQLGLTIIPSLGCNFECPYCFEDKHHSIMNERVQSAVAKFVEDRLPGLEHVSVSWFGGEPLVGKKALFALSNRLLELCAAANVDYSADITTNGYLLSEPLCEQLKAVRIGSAQVTLDGPPEVHDRMRPRVGGGKSFWRIVENIHHAIKYFPVSIRVNLDRGNAAEVEALLRILADQGLAGKVNVYPGQMFSLDEERGSAVQTSKFACMTKPEFSDVDLQFARLAKAYGFQKRSLPRPRAAPCTAVRNRDLVIGSEGELYKCWESVGNRDEVVGDICDYRDGDSRTAKWLGYDPFSDRECQTCVALPVCMGGCANHAMNPRGYENRCGVFRFNYRERIADFIDQKEGREATSAAA